MLRYAKAVDVYVKVSIHAHCCKYLCTYHFIFGLSIWVLYEGRDTPYFISLCVMMMDAI